jgi:hypothetical protein
MNLLKEDYNFINNAPLNNIQEYVFIIYKE